MVQLDSMMNQLSLKPCRSEADFQKLLDLESEFCRLNPNKDWHYHIGGILFEHLLFKSGHKDMFKYANLIYEGNLAIGYLCIFYLDWEFYLSLLPNKMRYFKRILMLKDEVFPDAKEFSITLSDYKKTAIHQALSYGYIDHGEIRYLGVLDLSKPLLRCVKRHATLRRYTPSDFEARVALADLPIDGNVSIETMRAYFESSYQQQYAREYVLIDDITHQMIGFSTWWVDQHSQTALLEPIACNKAYRGKGYMTYMILKTLHILKKTGIRYVYVSTNIDHNEAIALYQYCGFQAISKGRLLSK